MNQLINKYIKSSYLDNIIVSHWASTPPDIRAPTIRTGTYVSADFVLKDELKFREAINRGANVVAVDMERFSAVRWAKECGLSGVV